MSRPVRALGLLALPSLLIVGACADDGDVVAGESDAISVGGDAAPSDTGESTDTVASPYDITWTDSDGPVQEGTLEVPWDYANPEAGTFTLSLVRHRAQDPDNRVGSLLVNPGGPGVAGSDYARHAEDVYGQALLDSFDIIGWDPRGTGESTPAVDCVDDYDPYFSIDSSPDDPDEQQAILDAATRFGQACMERSGAILPYVSTENSARDMDSIRLALGEEETSYFGFSYGSELGVTWASLFPETVRAMVIDGAADQTVGYLDQNLEQAVGFEETFDTVLQQCGDDPNCPFHNDGDPGAAYDALSAEIDQGAVQSVVGRPDVTQGVLTTAVADALYSPTYWNYLSRALADLQNGDGELILNLYDDYYGREVDGSYGNDLEAYFAINCLDDPGSKDPGEVFDMQDDFAAAAPRIGPSYMSELVFCAAWPVPPAPPVAVDAAGAGPIVVIGTTGDPATPLDSTRHMAEALEDGRLIVVTADQHTGYGVNNCVNEAVDTYLVELVAPSDGLTCDN